MFEKIIIETIEFLNEDLRGAKYLRGQIELAAMLIGYDGETDPDGEMLKLRLLRKIFPDASLAVLKDILYGVGGAS